MFPKDDLGTDYCSFPGQHNPKVLTGQHCEQFKLSIVCSFKKQGIPDVYSRYVTVQTCFIIENICISEVL